VRITGKSVIVTGAGHGIGAALVSRIAEENPRGIVVSDIDEAAAAEVADAVRQAGGKAIALGADVVSAEQVHQLVAAAEAAFGSVDVVCSNAGMATARGLHAGLDTWQAAWSVNVLGHVHLAQAVLPSMVRRHTGHFLITASAVGLLGLPGDAPYSVTKHAAVGLAEWLAFTYQPRGVRVSVLCPLGVRTGLLMPAIERGHQTGSAIRAAGPIIEPAEVAEAVIRGFEEGRFLILPHPEVARMHAEKVADVDAWIAEQAARLPVRGGAPRHDERRVRVNEAT
jgi:NAD(P)-dependent dehydrogenase (short-subunit alcohol dehydrogenase family)